MPPPRGGGRHADDIANLWEAYAKCQAIHALKACRTPKPPSVWERIVIRVPGSDETWNRIALGSAVVSVGARFNSIDHHLRWGRYSDSGAGFMTGGLDEIRDLLMKETPPSAIPAEQVFRWMRSENIEVLGAAFEILHDAQLYTRIVPPLGFDDYREFHLRYYARCLRENPQGDWCDGRYMAVVQPRQLVRRAVAR